MQINTVLADIVRRYLPHFRFMKPRGRIEDLFLRPEIIEKVFLGFDSGFTFGKLQESLPEIFAEYDPCPYKSFVKSLSKANSSGKPTDIRRGDSPKTVPCPIIMGVIAGDVVGSIYEAHNIRGKRFKLLYADSRFTDDSVLCWATMDALHNNMSFESAYRKWFAMFPLCGFGTAFGKWAVNHMPKPYYSIGNGAAIRAIPIGSFFDDERSVLQVAKQSALCTHNHPIGIKGAMAAAWSIYAARRFTDKHEFIKEFKSRFSYDFPSSLSAIRYTHRLTNSCEDTVPMALQAFVESETVIDAIRNAISIGGDSDTIAALAGGIAVAFYKETSYDIIIEILKRIPAKILSLGLCGITAAQPVDKP